ncbi:hypothetical protein HFP57_00985 [Parasphingopyxis algicola]|uniref:2OG-Fe(II) oxygenase family protein n=1 Tax=Parasphingopyxis algicola TaxID=2026624 RepID=UPI0015A4568B|nr:2OG-Fe(II) oxygenase family protein [Parasphingopyxis algicola]QLC23746.1 hypothetical protein HFP57_00985 [Parasphingopyxis algicola]
MAGAGTSDAQARRDAAIAAYRRGDEDALALIGEALREMPNDGGLLISEAALKVGRGDPNALARIESIIRRAPDWVDGQIALAEFRWESGEIQCYLKEIEAALSRLPRHAGLWKAYIRLLAGTGRPSDAADAAHNARQQGFDLPMLRLIEAVHSGSAGDHARAEALLAGLPRDLPDLPLQLARHHLRGGRHDAAVIELDEARRRYPEDISAWALTEITWRLTGDSRHDWLAGNEDLAGPMDLALSSIDLDALTQCLRALHGTSARPVGQSVRRGTQTRGDIFIRAEEPIAALRVQLDAAVQAFWHALPAEDMSHPLLRHRQTEPILAIGWSIRITGGGFHVSHVHPGGVLSSAFYVAVPGTLDAKKEEGWIELGRPPDDLSLDLGPLRSFEPKPGRLVLFPSYLYHGTRPFPEGERLSVAFDVAHAGKVFS